MDSVRFGRALGIGARSAARALAGAVEAAAAPDPGRQRSPIPSAQPPAQPQTQSHAPGAVHSAARTAARATIQARETRHGIARGSRRFGESVWGPFARLSRVLWLEITGSFFALFALFAGSAVWDRRADFRWSFSFGPHPAATRHARLHLLVFLAMTIVFAYFSVSSFVRAYRK